MIWWLPQRSSADGCGWFLRSSRWKSSSSVVSVLHKPSSLRGMKDQLSVIFKPWAELKLSLISEKSGEHLNIEVVLWLMPLIWPVLPPYQDKPTNITSAARHNRLWWVFFCVCLFLWGWRKGQIFRKRTRRDRIFYYHPYIIYINIKHDTDSLTVNAYMCISDSLEL